jgi:hypothetical protein
MIQPNKPIIIVGTGRCGSTVFHRLLAKHPNVMWLSGFCDRYPARPEWNRRAVTAVNNPVLRPLLRGRVQPGECYDFWDQYAYGFSEPCRDLLRTDVTTRVRKQILAAMGTMLTPARHRLLLKITGWPRLGYLDEIFEDARFVHLIRDGRAVASSLLHVDFWRGWYGPQGWRAGLLSPEDQATWEGYDRSFVALAGLEWRIQMRAMEAARKAVDEARFLEIKYETFCEQPMETCRRVLGFVELSSSAAFEREVAATPIRNTSQRWREGLTAAQQQLLDELLQEDLRYYGYEASRPARQVPGAVGR